MMVCADAEKQSIKEKDKVNQTGDKRLWIKEVGRKLLLSFRLMIFQEIKGLKKLTLIEFRAVVEMKVNVVITF
jgi:hypothetical protein